MTRIVLGLLAGASLLSAAPARAQHRAQYDEQYEQQISTGVHEHDGGFLRLTGGAGPMNLESPVMGYTAKFSGTSFMYSVAGGRSLGDGLLLGGEVWGLSLSSPSVDWHGAGGTAESASIQLVGFGLHLTYYFMPANLYVTVVPSMATATMTYDGVTGQSDRGFGIRLAAGKEWWVTDDWGFGLSVQYARASNGDGEGGTVRTSSFGVALSATYN
jgi:hypothetical protein